MVRDIVVVLTVTLSHTDASFRAILEAVKFNLQLSVRISLI
jgi:hypothetical protein